MTNFAPCGYHSGWCSAQNECKPRKHVNRRAKHFGNADCKVAQSDAVVPSAKSLLSANPIASIHAQYMKVLLSAITSKRRSIAN